MATAQLNPSITNSDCSDTSAISCQLVDSEQEFSQLQQQWQALISSNPDYGLPLTFDWFWAWWKSFGKDNQLNILCFYQQEKLIAIAPFVREVRKYRGIPCQVLRLMANGHSPYCDVIFEQGLSSEERHQVLDLIIDKHPRHLILFNKVRADHETFNSYFQDLQTRKFKVGVQPDLITPTVEITHDWDDFFAGKSRKFRKGISKKISFFQDNQLQIKHQKLATNDDSSIKDMIAVSGKSWKSEIGKDLQSNQASREFLLTLISKFVTNGQVSIWFAYAEEKPVAYEFHLELNGIVYPLRADFDESYRKFTPGSVVEYFALKSLFSRPEISQYYSCANNYQYLSHWSKQVVEHVSYEIFQSDIKSQLLYQFEYRAMPVLRRLRSRWQKWRKQSQGNKPS